MTAKEIKNIPLLSQVPADVLEKFVKQGHITVKQYKKGVTVHHQHDSCNNLDVVRSGRLIAYSLSENGSAVTMFEFAKNSIIGANLLFGESHAYPLNIYSVSDCALLHIALEAVVEFLHDYHFTMQYIKSLSLNSQGMNKKIAMFTQKTLRENLLDYIRQQSVLQNSSNVVLPISKKELSDYLGVQRPSLFREFKKLKDEKILAVNNRTIKIL